jgi:hypothetical protein
MAFLEKSFQQIEEGAISSFQLEIINLKQERDNLHDQLICFQLQFQKSELQNQELSNNLNDLIKKQKQVHQEHLDQMKCTEQKLHQAKQEMSKEIYQNRILSQQMDNLQQQVIQYEEKIRVIHEENEIQSKNNQKMIEEQTH